MRKNQRNFELFTRWKVIGLVDERDIFKGASTKTPSLIQKQPTYSQLSVEFGLSESRVRQIILSEMRKIRESRGIRPWLKYQPDIEPRLSLVVNSTL